MSTYITKNEAERVIDLLGNADSCHPCTFTRDAVRKAKAVLRKEVRAGEKLEAAKAENAKLREGLKKLVDWGPVMGEYIDDTSTRRYRRDFESAKAALQGGTK
jgi:hypothetical protein